MTMEELNEEAALFLAAGHRYHQAAAKAGMHGAVIWVKDTNGFGVVFTRGEYCQQIVQNIEGMGPTRYFGELRDAS